MACILSPAECFHKNVVMHDAGFKLTPTGGGWYSAQCPAGHHGKPLRLRAGDKVHIIYKDLGGCPDLDVFKGLIKAGLPRECLKKPSGAPRLPAPAYSSEADAKLADELLDVLFSEGTPAERIVRVAVLALGGEVPEGYVCDLLADKLRLSPRLVYRATETERRRNRKSQ